MKKTSSLIFLHKSLPKLLLLLVVLFLSGCSVTNAISLVSGRSGTYWIYDDKYTFTISVDGGTLCLNDNESEYELAYLSSGGDYVAYGGWVDPYTYITVALTEISEFNGVFNQYENETQLMSVGFFWNIPTSD